MPIQFAFSSLACSAWDFVSLAGKAKEFGYDGVELSGSPNDLTPTASNVFLSDPRKVRDTFAEKGIKIAALSSSIAMTGNKKDDARLAKDVMRFIETAQSVGAEMVKVLDTSVRPGQTRADAGLALGAWLSPLADFAGDRGICLLVENAISFRQAREMWLLMEQLNHPAIGCCWDLLNAGLIGESPLISVPTLNSRISYVQMKDALITSAGPELCELGKGDLQVEKFLIRLRGIGYSGWITFDWDRAQFPKLGEPDTVLPEAVKKLRDWTKPYEPVKKPVKAAPAKPAAAKAPPPASVPAT